MTTIELEEVLRLHSLFLSNNVLGEKANLREADLREANLSGADLIGTSYWGNIIVRLL